MSHAAADIIERPPGHARVLGVPRSGKTSLLVERFHHLSRAGHRPLVIAFGREQQERLLDRLIPPGTARFGPLPVTTHGLLAGRIMSTVRPNRARTLRDVDEQIVLDRVLNARPDLLRSDLRSIADSRALRDALLRVLHVLAQNGVSAAGAEAAAKKTPDARAKDVLRLFAAYRRHLDERGLVTFYDAAWQAARLVGEDATIAVSAGVRDVILVDDFQDLDAGQFELLRALAPPDGAVALEAFGDPTGSRFSFRGTSERFLMDELPAVYRAADYRLPPPRPANAALAACLDVLVAPDSPATAPAAEGLASLPLFAATPTTRESAPANWNVRVHAVSACDEVAEAQHAALRVRGWIEQGMVPGDIAVVARDPERVASLVLHAFRERGVPIDVGVRADSAADAFVHALVGALGRDSDGRFVEALDASPLLAAFCDARRLPRDAARAAVTLRAAYSSGGGFDLERLLRESGADAFAGSSARAIDEWNRYAEVVTHAGGHPSLDEFRHAYLEAAPGETRHGDKPRLLSARAASGSATRAAIVMGCADGVFPRVEVEGGYLPFVSLAAALGGVNPGAARDLGARVDRERAERDEMALLLSALLCARDEICLSHPRKSGDQALTVPPTFAPLFANAAEVGRDTPAGHRAASAIARAPADTELADATRAIDWMAGGWIRPPGEPRRPVFDALALSPSRLQTFTTCERKFFFQRILRIEEPGSIYLEIGNVFHEVLKELIPVGANSAEVRAALQSDATEIIDRAITTVMPAAGEWLRTLTHVHMRLMLHGVHTLEEKRDGEYRVLSVETSASYPPDGDAVLTGRLDRIDDVEGLGPVVVDYKTSMSLSKTAARIVQEIEEKRQHWQVSVYSALAGSLGHSAKGFLYYVVPPGEKVNAVGVQLSGGRLHELIRREGREQPRYDHLPPATLQTVLDEAMTIHADVLAGACAYARTDDPERCGNCHYIRVCRRTGE